MKIKSSKNFETNIFGFSFYMRPRISIGHCVCPSVCLSVRLSVRLSVGPEDLSKSRSLVQIVLWLNSFMM